jgi:hypothetical protein
MVLLLFLELFDLAIGATDDSSYKDNITRRQTQRLTHFFGWHKVIAEEIGI